MNEFEKSSLKANLLITLCKLAELSISKSEFTYTTGQLAFDLKISQQTASRHLIVLEQRGLIRRVKVGKREIIRITPNGFDLLKELYFRLKDVFEQPINYIFLEGELFSGLGEGSYYIGQEGYREQLEKKLGFDPYPGTLNIRLKPGYENERNILNSLPLISIKGFTTEKRSFGRAKCAKAIMNDEVQVSIILAMRSHYGSDVVEIVTKENLRKKLKLKDGDTIKLRIMIPRYNMKANIS
jgi:riboflavin kinase